MPLSSVQISQMNGMYAQQYAQQQQYASSIGVGTPLSESVVGGGMNRMAAIGGPMMTAGMGLMGLDPISLGLRAGMGASGMGMGFAGAGAVGLGVAGLAGAGVMAAGYATNQMFSGAQQQQAFNGSMNSQFRFANQFGGQGFGRGGLGEIGGMMRNMSTEQGSMGQMVGFEELGRLASNMGRMGMAQGVRDAKDFSEKFREMVKTVKQIAESMGTSLEEAQKMMGAMRGAGVFGSGSAANFTSRVRAGSVAGGMATSELTGMMQVGSQISRMVGGRGRAGAAGGIETLTNIGVAQQMGIMSEEDIYNTTGLTGAEGRRAMATRQMEMSAQFLKGGLGRRFLASVAGKGGQLDASSVEEYMAGGVGTERTTQMYQRNLAKVGRADFIRNEGRLRGAALEKFGGLAPMIAMKGWLDQRGINANEDNDRAMIFMQRQLGMGSDESEMMLRQVRELPNLLRQRRVSGQDDEFAQKMAERRSHTGLEGIKHKFEKARADVNSVLQQVGADFYESMSEQVDRTVNSITGNYVKQTRSDVAGAFRSVMSGGALGQQAAATTFGVGGSSFRSAGATGSLFGKGKSDLDTFAGADADRFAKAGFAFGGSDLAGHLNTVQQIAGAFTGGDASLANRGDVQMLGANSASQFTNAITNGTISGKGMDRLEGFGKFLRQQAAGGNTSMAGLAVEYSKAGPVRKAQIMAAFSGKGGADVDQSGNFEAPELRGIYGTSGLLTAGDAAEKVGKSFSNSSSFGRDALRAGVSSALSLVGAGGLGGAASSLISSSNSGDTAVGRFLVSEGGRDLTGRMMNNDKKIRDEAFKGVQKEIASLMDKGGDRTSEESARLRGLKGMVFAQKLTELEVNGATPEQIDAEAGRLAKEHGLSVEEVKKSAKTIGILAEENKGIARTEAAGRFGDESRKTLAGLMRSNLVTGTGTSLSINAKAAASMGAGASGQAFLSAMLETQKAFAQMGPGADNRALFEQGSNAAQNMNAAMAGMSVAEQRKLAQGLVGVGGTEDARAELNRSAAIGEHVTGGKRRGKGGALSSAADVLGVNLSQGQIQQMLGKGGGGIDAVAKAISEELGVGGNEAFMKQLKGSLTSIEGGKIGEGSVGLKGLMDDESVQKARRLRQDKADAADPSVQMKNISDNTKIMADNSKTMAGLLEDIKLQGKSNPESVSK